MAGEFFLEVLANVEEQQHLPDNQGNLIDKENFLPVCLFMFVYNDNDNIIIIILVIQCPHRFGWGWRKWKCWVGSWILLTSKFLSIHIWITITIAITLIVTNGHDRSRIWEFFRLTTTFNVGVIRTTTGGGEAGAGTDTEFCKWSTGRVGEFVGRTKSSEWRKKETILLEEVLRRQQEELAEWEEEEEDHDNNESWASQILGLRTPAAD
jgi:hypothetical protein